MERLTKTLTQLLKGIPIIALAMFTLLSASPVYADYPCLRGQTAYGDGSACEGGGAPRCAVWGNLGLPRCDTVCPSGQRKYGDGSACTGGGEPNCAIWGNPSIPRCKLKCPTGQQQYGDGSACRGGSLPDCAIYGNPGMPRCSGEEMSKPKPNKSSPSGGNKEKYKPGSKNGGFCDINDSGVKRTCIVGFRGPCYTGDPCTCTTNAGKIIPGNKRCQ